LNESFQLFDEEGLEPIIKDLIKSCLVRDPINRPTAQQLI